MNVIAVDVGTTSVRLAIISFTGEQLNEVRVVASEKRDIQHKQDGLKFEQKSSEIWSAICECSRICISKSKISARSIKSIAFSATCSLVISESNSTNEDDVIMWMDHRATDQANEISCSQSQVLNQFGGTCSPEFSLSKLKWLKDNDVLRFNNATGFFELPDWLVYKCISSDGSVSPLDCPRSLCCVTCKWGYDVENRKHCDIVNNLDLNINRKIGKNIFGPGSIAGYVCSKAANDLGLISEESQCGHQDKENLKPDQLVAKPNIRVAVSSSLIDAHSGMLAMLSVPTNEGASVSLESTFCSLAGTSSCHMLLSSEGTYISGIWGPYKDVVLKGFYLLEAGQSLTGKLIEICIESHSEGKSRLGQGQQLYEIIEHLNVQIEASRTKSSTLHILPTFHGNRSPLANPKLRGGIYGLSAEGEKSLLEHYVATVESLAYEMKFIVETLGTKLDKLMISGGLMKNHFYMQTLADVLQCRVVKTSLENIDFMVMGSGLVARHTGILSLNESRLGGTLDVKDNSALNQGSIQGLKYSQLSLKSYFPNSDQFCYHEKKYSCYREFVKLSTLIDKMCI